LYFLGGFQGDRFFNTLFSEFTKVRISKKAEKTIYVQF